MPPVIFQFNFALALAGDNLDVKLEFALPENASPLIRGLYIDNTDWNDWMKTHSREK